VRATTVNGRSALHPAYRLALHTPLSLHSHVVVEAAKVNCPLHRSDENSLPPVWGSTNFYPHRPSTLAGARQDSQMEDT